MKASMLSGGQKMKRYIEEYGAIIVLVAVILLMLLFSKTSFARSIQNAIIGSANHIVETGQNITEKEVSVKSGDILEIEGKEYFVVEQRTGSNALIIAEDALTSMQYNSSLTRADGLNASTYEGSDIDKYLENAWYKGLSTKMQSAIQTTNIKQASYELKDADTDAPYLVKKSNGYGNQTYNTIARKVFLPSLEEIEKCMGKAEGISRAGIPEKMTRDSFSNKPDYYLTYIGEDILPVLHQVTTDEVWTFPAFVIDLSQVNYDIVGNLFEY